MSVTSCISSSNTEEKPLSHRRSHYMGDIELRINTVYRSRPNGMDGYLHQLSMRISKFHINYADEPLFKRIRIMTDWRYLFFATTLYEEQL